METLISLAFLLQVARIAVPYTLAALGGTLSERSGVINLALEGMLLIGAFAATWGAHVGGAAFGLLCGLGGGLVWGALYAGAVVWLRGDQVMTGIAFNLIALALTRYLLKVVFDSSSNSPHVEGFTGGTWDAVAILVVWGLALGLLWSFRHTVPGLRLRASGENPLAADSLGVSVLRVRAGAVICSGVLAGAGGAWLALSNEGFVDGMSGGRGYIAIAAMILGGWRPLAGAAACLLFAFADALQLNLQTIAQSLPRELVQALPYVVTMVALAGGARIRAPAALGRPFERG